jgi:hypothetical protein
VAAVKASAFVILFLWLSLALGRRLIRWLGVEGEGSPAEYGVVALGSALGVLQLVPIALGSAGAFSVEALRIAMALLTLALASDMLAVSVRVRQFVQDWRPPQVWLMAWAAALVPGLLAIFFLAVTPAIDADGLGFHLTVPKRWLAMGTMGNLPTYTVANMPMGMEMLFTIAMVFAGDAAAKLLHFALGAAGAAALYLAAKRLHGPILGAVAVTLYLFGPVAAGPLLGLAYIEGAVAFALLASALAWLVWFRARQEGWRRAAFALAGVAVAFKVTAGLFPVALLVLTWLIEGREARRRGESPLGVVTGSWPLLLLTGAPLAPWLLRATVFTGNPFFPVFASWIPSDGLSPALAAQWELYNRYLSWGTRWGSAWSLETRKTIVLGVSLVATAAAGVIYVLLRSWLARVTTVVVWGTVLVQIVAVGLYTRYWVPLASVLQLPILAMVAALFPLTVPRSWLRPAVVALTAVLSVATARNLVGQDPAGFMRTALGLQSQDDFLLRHLPLYPIFQYANRELPANARIVLGSYCGGFHFDRQTFCLDIAQSSLSTANWSEFTADCRRLGVTHVLALRILATGQAEPTSSNVASSGFGSAFRETSDAVLARLLSTHGRLLASAADQGLYEIEDGAFR